MTMYRERAGDISAVSNELEFGLPRGRAGLLIASANKILRGLLMHEVNPDKMIELTASMAKNSQELNFMVTVLVRELSELVQNHNLQIHGGSSLYQDVSALNPNRYRTTSLSNTFADGLLDIASQQLVIGVAPEGKNGGESFAMDLYNCLRQLSPILLALSASSPYKYENERIVDTGFQSRRPHQYRQMSRYLPEEMFQTVPITSLAQYEDRRAMISNKVKNALLAGRLDANLTELYRIRENGLSYAPFDMLDPHQLYGWVRIRPDHANADSLLSLEVRICDMPFRIETIQMLNSFITGLAYYASSFGFEDIQNILQPLGLHDIDIGEMIMNVSYSGLDTVVGSGNNVQRIRSMVLKLTNLSVLGLQDRRLETHQLVTQMEQILNRGNDAEVLRNEMAEQVMTPIQLEHFLASMLYQSVINQG